MRRIDIANAHSGYRRRRRDVRRIVGRVLEKERCREATLGIVFTDDKLMRSLNAKYLDHRRTTDVLSFPLSSPHEKCLDGEIYVNLDQAKRQSEEYGVSFKSEVFRLIIHGTLHLLGYDDDTKTGKRHMTDLENLYLKGIG